MAAAYIDAADVQFPAQCIGCGGAPVTMHDLSARRGIDLLFVAHWEFLDIPVPVCERCKRRRRVGARVDYLRGKGRRSDLRFADPSTPAPGSRQTRAPCHPVTSYANQP